MRRLLLSERIDPHCPATFLRLHRDAVVLLERSLADAIGYKAYNLRQPRTAPSSACGAALTEKAPLRAMPAGDGLFPVYLEDNHLCVES